MAIQNPVFMRYRSSQYNGSNSSEIMTMLNAVDPGNPLWIFHSANSNGMIFTDLHGTQFPMNTTDWVVVDPIVGYINRYTNASYAVHFAQGAELSALMNVTPVDAMAVNTVPTLAGNTQTTIQVTLSKTFANTNYTAATALSGTISLLGALSILSTTIVSGSRVDVVVRNTGLVSLGGALLITIATAIV